MKSISYDDLVYLAIGVCYLLIRYIKRDTTVQQTTTNSPRVPMSQSMAPEDDFRSHNKPAKEPISASFVSPISLVKTPSKAARNIILQPAGPHTTRQKMAYMLRRYGGLKKAIIMHEIIRIHDS